MVSFSELLDKEVKPSLGCTEPVAVGYATSLAYNAILGKVPDWLKDKLTTPEATPLDADELEVTEIQVLVDRDIYKNALSVGIPRSGGRKGIRIAAAMGMLSYPEAKGMEKTLFATLKPEDLDKAQSMVDRVQIKLVDGWEERDEISIQASVTVRQRGTPHEIVVGKATIEKNHGNVTDISVARIEEAGATCKALGASDDLSVVSITEVVKELDNLADGVASRMIEMLEMNLKVSRAGLEGSRGLGVGTALKELVDEGCLADDLITLAQIMAASAADARMAGCDYEVMSSAGSGNQGITVSLPLIAVAIKVGYDVPELCRKNREGALSSEEKKKLDTLVKALALSNIITSYVTYHTGYLSAMCGCAVKAGIGAASGIAYLLDGKVETVESAIQNMAANITGLICDGAKEGCALKLTSAASAAILSAVLAEKGIRVPADNGIVAERVEDTIRNLGRVYQAMIGTDVEIVSIMRDKWVPIHKPLVIGRRFG